MYGARSGLVAQLSTGLASFLPVLFGASDALVDIIQVTAPVALLVPIVSLAASSRIPASIGRREAVASVFVSAAFLTFVCVLALAVDLALFAHRFGGKFLFLSGVALLFGQGLYGIVQGVLTRVNRYGDLMRFRLAYGVTALFVTFLMCLFSARGSVFVLANALAFTAASGFGAFRVRDLWSRRGWRDLRVVGGGAGLVRVSVGCLRRGLVLGASYSAGGVYAQASSVLVSLFGAGASAWSVAVRISSGMQTIGEQIVGPKLDMMVIASRSDVPRGCRGQGVRGTLNSYARWSLLWAAVAAIAIALGVAWVWLLSPSTIVLGRGLVFAMVGYLCTTVGISPVMRVLGIAGLVRERVSWDTFRFALGVSILFFVRGDSVVWVLGVSGIVLLAWHTKLLTLVPGGRQ